MQPVIENIVTGMTSKRHGECPYVSFGWLCEKLVTWYSALKDAIAYGRLLNRSI
jgi:hypothetical protein